MDTKVSHQLSGGFFAPVLHAFARLILPRANRSVLGGRQLEHLLYITALDVEPTGVTGILISIHAV